MGGSSFEQLVQEVLKQQQLMDQLEHENRDLRRQLADVREGRGVFLDIGGTRFALTAESVRAAVASQSIMSAEVSAPEAASVESSVVVPVLSAVSEAPTEALIPISEAPTTAFAPVSEIHLHEVMEPRATQMPNTPLPEIELFEEEEHKPSIPTFLEEVMISEFAVASTSSSSVWQGPAKAQVIGEEEKAALRRQLIGSFLLE